jgi:RNA polymerase sigma-70 factor (ECF subfamily)
MASHNAEASVRELVERAERGDVAAFELLVEAHVPMMFRLATAMVGIDEARDVTQDALVNAWTQLRRLERPERLEAWLRTILMNRARNVLRTRRRHPTVSFDPVVGHGDAHVEEPIPGLHRRMAVEEALAVLRPDERAVIVLHYLGDLTLQQVAKSLSIREGTAKSRLHAGLRALRLHFAGESA